MVNAGRHMVHQRAAPKLAAALLCALLAGCGTSASPPESWWHEYEGGVIAQDRPPPPGINAPFPNFAQVPTKPAVLPATARQVQLQDLTETRDLSLAGAAAAPLPVAAPSRPLQQSAPVDSNAAATMTSVASSAPPSGTARVPAQAVIPPNSAPVIADIDHPPELAPAPPSPADIADAGGALGAPTQTSTDFDHLSVGFDPAADQITRDATPGLVAFAQTHLKKTIIITGHGDTPGLSDANLELGWRRARAVAVTLVTAGVPAGDLRLASEASASGAGRGAELSLLK